MIEQGSQEWHQQRVGKATASRVADIVARTKTGWGASRANYAAELVAERLSGTPAPSFTSAAMQWGTDTEPEARSFYEFMTNTIVEPAPFVPHPTIGDTGASPDGFVGDDGLIEVKCPGTATHIETLLGAAIADKYIKQMQWQMSCTGRKWCDFVSYDPRLPETMRLHVERVMRNDVMIAELGREIVAFLAEVRETVARLRAKYEPADTEPILLAGG